MSLALCPLIGFALLVGLLIWLSIRSPKAGAIGWGLLAVCVLGGLALIGVRVQVSPAGSSTGFWAPGIDLPWGMGMRKLALLAIAGVVLAFISLVVWGFVRNPKKGFTVMGGVFFGLLLIGILAFVLSILLPAFARARQKAAPDSTPLPAPMAARLSPEVLATTTRPAADALTNDPWVTAVASSNQIGEYVCRELACAAMTREAIQRLRESGRIAGEAGPRFVLTMEARDPTTFETWKRMEPAMRAGIRAEFQDRADRLVQIAWAPDFGADGLQAERLLSGAVLRWFEAPAGEGARNLSAELSMPAESHLRLIRDGQHPSSDAVRSGATRFTWRTVLHYDKGWVLGTEWPAGRPGPFIVGRSEPVASAAQARRWANEDACRQLAEKIRAQLKRVLGTDPLSAGADALLEQADWLTEEAAKLGNEALQTTAGTGRATATVRNVPAAGRAQGEAFSSAARSLRQQADALRKQAERATEERGGRGPKALVQSDKLTATAERLRQHAETFERHARHATSAASGSKGAAPVQTELFAQYADRLRQEAKAIRDQATAVQFRGSSTGGRSDADSRLAAADAVAAGAVSRTGIRRDECLQQGIRYSSGSRTMAAVLIDASPATIDALVAEAIAAPAGYAPSFVDAMPRQFVAVAALLGLIVLAYAFLAAGRYGSFKWPVRIAAAAGFVVLCVMLMRAQGGDPLMISELPATAVVRATSTPLAERLVGPARTSAAGVETAVTVAVSTDIDDSRLRPLDLLVCGEYLLLGGHPEEAAKAIEAGIRRGGTENWYEKSLGLALLSTGRVEEAKRAFGRAAGNANSWKAKSITNASIDSWTAAYFMDLVSQEVYVDRWRKDNQYACFPWFYVGQRMEIEGKRDEAVAAYRKSVELGKRPGAHYRRNWSAYRLGVLEGVIPAPSSRPSRDTASSRPAQDAAANPPSWRYVR